MTVCQLLTLAEHHRAAHQQAQQPAAPQDSGGPFGLMAMASMTRT